MVGYVKMKTLFWLFPFLVCGSTPVWTGVSSLVFPINEIIKKHDRSAVLSTWIDPAATVALSAPFPLQGSRARVSQTPFVLPSLKLIRTKMNQGLFVDGGKRKMILTFHSPADGTLRR